MLLDHAQHAHGPLQYTLELLIHVLKLVLEELEEEFPHPFVALIYSLLDNFTLGVQVCAQICQLPVVFD